MWQEIETEAMIYIGKRIRLTMKNILLGIVSSDNIKKHKLKQKSQANEADSNRSSDWRTGIIKEWKEKDS